MPIYKHVNKDFFKIWTPNMAYILGFFAADGYMTLNKRGAHFWGIEITDGILLKRIKEAINSDHKIGLRPVRGREKQLYRLQIGSKEMFNDLLSLGFTGGKTKRLAVPEVPAVYFRDFVRGYFDGDGNVWFGHVHRDGPKDSLAILTVFTSSSRKFLDELRRRLRILDLIRGSVKKGVGNYYRLTYSIRSSMKLYDFIYNHPILVSGEDLFLTRKKEVFDRYLTMRS